MSFDVAYCEIFGALSAGATLCQKPAGIQADPAALGRWLTDAEISVLQVIPRLFRQILHAVSLADDSGRGLGGLETLMFVGEPLPADLVTAVRQALGPDLRVINVYGPTEVVAATFHEVTEVSGDEATVPVGRPIDGRRVYVLDAGRRVCPPGVTGEIWIRSPYLSAGYHGDSVSGERSFLPDPVAGDDITIYRTGDLARIRADGALVFAGRLDNQVKLNGIRIELGEVESAVGRLPGVRDCVATVVDADLGGQRLIAYAVTEPGLDLQEVRAALRQSVPAHLVPAMIIALDALPRTASGKVDRRALPEPPASRGGAGGHVPPRTALERELADLVRTALDVDQISMTDNFFDLGGNSLQAAGLVNRIRELCGVEIPVQTLFAEPTLAAVVAATEQVRRELGHDQRLQEIEADLAALSDDQVRALLAEQRSLSACPQGDRTDG